MNNDDDDDKFPQPPVWAIIFIFAMMVGVLSVAIWGFIEVVLAIGRAVN